VGLPRRHGHPYEARPLLDAFRAWLEGQKSAVLPKSPVGQAVAYALGNWAALVRYTDDGDLAIDNNAAERALRFAAIGRTYADLPVMRSPPCRHSSLIPTTAATGAVRKKNSAKRLWR
jgi:hypothetical protein